MEILPVMTFHPVPDLLCDFTDRHMWAGAIAAVHLIHVPSCSFLRKYADHASALILIPAEAVDKYFLFHVLSFLPSPYVGMRV